MKIVLAGDVGPEVGLGHQRRLEAIATVLRESGHSAAVITTDAPSSTDADLLVVDSYVTRADDVTRYDAPLIAAIDELGRDLAVDVVIDPTPGAAAHRGARARRAFAGAAYAIVGSEFGAPPRPPRPRVERVLVTLGASRAGTPAPTLAAEIAVRLPALRVVLAVGPWLESVAVDGVELVHAPDGLGELIRDSDIVVTAGGVTLLEACASARPTVTIPVAENQQRAVEFLVGVGATRREKLERAPDVVGELVRDHEARERLGRAARRTIDGAGAMRVAGALIELAENGR